MGIYDISFEKLGIYLHDVPKSFSVFGFEIAFYGLCIGIAAICGFALALRVAGKSGFNKEHVWDYIIWGIIVGVIGARLYYVIFAWDFYKNDLLSILNLRQGGLAIYGGVIGAVGAMAVFCKVKKVSFTQLMDVAVPGLILGQIIGRWGNFFNREVFGSYSDGLLSMQIPLNCPYLRSRDITDELYAMANANGVDYISVHPTFLYEGLLNLLVLVVMLVYRKHKKFHGEIALIYLGGYGIVRFFVEGIRTDQLKMIGTDIPVSQALGIVLFVAAVVADVVVRIRLSKPKNTAVAEDEAVTEEAAAAEDEAVTETSGMEEQDKKVEE